MGRYQSRRHYDGMRRFDMLDLPKGGCTPAARWRGQWEWADGSSIGVEKCEGSSLRFLYSVDGQDMSHSVDLVYTPMHFGGAQAYLLCPGCSMRTRVLRFLGADLRCRLCIRAIYRSQSVDAGRRALHRFQKLRARLRPGTENLDLTYFPRRPKRMRRTTYARVKAEALAALERYHVNLDAGLVRVLARIAPADLAVLIG